MRTRPDQRGQDLITPVSETENARFCDDQAMDVSRAVPNLTVSDLDAAITRWRNIFGMDVVMNHGWIATLADGNVQISLMTRDLTAAVNPALSVEVDDLDAALTAARAEGLEIVHPVTDEPWGVRRFFFKDADGTVVNVLTHRRDG
jgi:catechol 2,3-dioxygenase-like lactoylglutathione lyase family enzyme